jgi:hypothetical protein
VEACRDELWELDRTDEAQVFAAEDFHEASQVAVDNAHQVKVLPGSDEGRLIHVRVSSNFLDGPGFLDPVELGQTSHIAILFFLLVAGEVSMPPVLAGLVAFADRELDANILGMAHHFEGVQINLHLFHVSEHTELPLRPHCKVRCMIDELYDFFCFGAVVAAILQVNPVLGAVAIGVVEDEKWIGFDGLYMGQVFPTEDVDESCLGVVEGQTFEEGFNEGNLPFEVNGKFHNHEIFPCQAEVVDRLQVPQLDKVLSHLLHLFSRLHHMQLTFAPVDPEVKDMPIVRINFRVGRESTLKPPESAVALALKGGLAHQERITRLT